MSTTHSRSSEYDQHLSGMSDASSQSADNETDTSPQLEVSAPPKKKRTRTLTTPHQSAVLHALLAKSRFPTTAMREEVGRQIGLSARKVQIWFQNQRQKARRPQSDSAPLSRPPQFGPFPIITPAGPSSSSSLPPESHSAPRSAKSPVDSALSLDSPVLSGPGIPSWSSPYQRSAEERDPPRRPLTSPESVLGNSQHHRLSHSMSTRDSRGSTRGLSPSPPHYSTVLPPISLEPDSYVSRPSSFPPLSPASVNTPPVDHPIHPGIPPPFVLQPQPQWDPQTFMPYTRPQFTSWLQPLGPSSVGTHDRLFSPRRPIHPSGELHHIIPPPSSRNQQFSTSTPSFRASQSTEADDEA